MDKKRQKSALAGFVALIIIAIGSYLDQTLESETVNKGLEGATKGPFPEEVFPEEDLFGISPTTSSEGLPYGIVEPPPSPDIGWDCKTIDETTPNAFRAIQKAGNPKKWEDPPYKRIAGPNAPDKDGVQEVSDWNLLGFKRDREFLTYEGDKICVRVGKER